MCAGQSAANRFGIARARPIDWRARKAERIADLPDRLMSEGVRELAPLVRGH
jgi:hypothetical protein